MSRVVTLIDFTPPAREDGHPWTEARIEEAPDRTGPWSALDSFVFGVAGQAPPDADPSKPSTRDFTTTQAQLEQGWYRVVFIDAAAHEQPVGPIFVPTTSAAYTTAQAVRRVLAPDGDPTLATAASLSDDDLEQAIEEAASDINSRLAVRYALPFDVVPTLVENLNRDLAAYKATLTYRRNTPLDPDDPIRLRYADAKATLDGLASGKVALPLPEAGALQTTAQAAVVNPYEGDLFGPEDFDLATDDARPRWQGGSEPDWS